MTPNPYDVLGVDPSSSTEQIEARYRLLLREYHPDLHQGEGPESLARCEAMTRTINAAMARIRDLTLGPQRPPSQSRGTTRSQDATSDQWFGANPFYRPRDHEPDPTGQEGPDDPARAWFGEPVDHSPDEPVPCPLCGAPFDRLAAYEAHLQREHNFRQVVTMAPRPPSRYNPTQLIGWLRYIPSWFAGIVALTLWVTIGFRAFLVAFSFLCLVMFTQTSSIFKRRR